MYLSATVKVPEIPGKITRRKMGTNVYVLFEVGRVYDPKRQFNLNFPAFHPLKSLQNLTLR